MAEQKNVLRPGQAPLNSPGSTQERSLLQAIQMETAPEATSFLMFFANNAKLLMACVGLFIIVVMGFGIFTYTAQKTLNAAKDDLGTILQQSDQATRSGQLESFVAKAPAGVMLAGYLALARSYETQLEYGKAAEAWGKIAELAENPMRAQALMGQADALASAGEFAQALKVAEKLLSEVKDNKNYLLPVNSMIADMAERSGNRERAAEASRAVLASPRMDNSDYYWAARLDRLTSSASLKDSQGTDSQGAAPAAAPAASSEAPATSRSPGGASDLQGEKSKP